jgi:tRNA threonylcarbamoyladenosine biosynthesis protein TsaB
VRAVLILAIDTAMSACAAGVWRDGHELARESQVMERGQAEALMPMIARVMARAQVRYADLGRIAVTCGPGSFTGVRVGLAAARGLSVATGVATVGLSTTEVLAAAVPADERQGDTRILAAVDSRRGDVFAQLFAADGRPTSAIVTVAPEAVAAWTGLGRLIVVGDGTSMVVNRCVDALASRAAPTCDPASIARLAATRVPDPHGPAPIYVRPPDVTLAGHSPSRPR